MLSKMTSPPEAEKILDSTEEHTCTSGGKLNIKRGKWKRRNSQNYSSTSVELNEETGMEVDPPERGLTCLDEVSPKRNEDMLGHQVENEDTLSSQVVNEDTLPSQVVNEDVLQSKELSEDLDICPEKMEIEQANQENRAQMMDVITSVDSESLDVMDQMGVDKTKSVSESTAIAVDTSEGKTKSQGSKTKGRKPKTKHKTKPQPDPNFPSDPKIIAEEILKLLPEPGNHKFTDEQTSKLREFFRSGKAVECPRPDCDKSYKQFVSFRYHVVRCGIQTTSIPCTICGKLFRSENGLKYHLDHVHADQNESSNSHSLLDDKQDDGNPQKLESIVAKNSFASRYGRRRRAAIKKTDSSNEPSEKDEATKEEDNNDVDEPYLVDEMDEQSSEVGSNQNWREHVKIIDIEPGEKVMDMTDETLEKKINECVEKLRKTKNKVPCPKNCGYSLRMIGKLRKHLTVCTGESRRKFRCLLCDDDTRTFRSMIGVKGHILTQHQKAKESDDEHDSDYSEGRRVRKTPNAPRRYRRPGDFDYEKKTRTWYETFHSELVYPTWKPTLKHWNKLPESEVDDYLPVRKVSPGFKIQPSTKTRTEAGNDSPEFRLPIFSSVPINTNDDLCSLTFNVGGSVWAMDWVPLPVDEKSCDQYLAIGCHRDQNQLHLVQELYQEKGVLQIWRLPLLQNRKRAQHQAEFSLGIAYDYGPLWDIRWCPSGAWERAAGTPEHLRRLGLLALACADGKVRIISVPLPESLIKNVCNEDKPSYQNLIFRVTPHMELSPGSTYRKYCGECGAVWSVAWLPLQDHKKIMASYCDGTVAIWDLTTQNSLLRLVTAAGLSECLFPISHFQAHCSAIRVLAWCPSDPNYFATGGYDRFTKIWDLHNTSQPVTTIKRGLHYSFTWPLHGACLLFTCDTALNKGSGRGTRSLDYFLDPRPDSRKKQLEHPTNCFIFHNSTTWDNDYCNWSNMVVSADASGELLMSVLRKFHTKGHSKPRMPIFRTTFEETVSPDSDGKQDNNLLDDENQTPNQNFTNKTSDECSEKTDYKLVFIDTHPMMASKAEQKRLNNKDTQMTILGKPTYAALHKVRWNPNLTSYYWLAAGGRAGIVRICYVGES